jgi:hypothetical protein
MALTYEIDIHENTPFNHAVDLDLILGTEPSLWCIEHIFVPNNNMINPTIMLAHPNIYRNRQPSENLLFHQPNNPLNVRIPGRTLLLQHGINKLLLLFHRL